MQTSSSLNKQNIAVQAAPLAWPQISHFLEQGWVLVPGLVPADVAPRAGDVLFMHPLLLHAKPMNVGKRPRFAMHYKW
jgi:hypothetical protein